MPSYNFAGPVPPTGREYCVLCAAGWKATALKLCKERSIDLTGNVNLAGIMTGQPLPNLAVADGPVTLPVPPGAGQPGQQMVVMAKQCWSHLIAIDIVDTALQLAPAGFGGARLLGGGG
jgi:hypothetical protein